MQDAQKGKFSAVSGKYELIETDAADTTAAASMVASGGCPSSPAKPVKVLPSKLDPATKELVELVFRWGVARARNLSVSVVVVVDRIWTSPNILGSGLNGLAYCLSGEFFDRTESTSSDHSEVL